MEPVIIDRGESQQFFADSGEIKLNSLEIEAIKQLRQLADKLEKGELWLKRFSATVNEDSQTLEVEA